MVITPPSLSTPTTDTIHEPSGPVGLLVGLVHGLAWLVETESVETELMYAGADLVHAINDDLQTLLALQAYYPHLLPLQATPAVRHAIDVINTTLRTWDTQ